MEGAKAMSRCSTCGSHEHYENWHEPEQVAARQAEAHEELLERIVELEARVARLEAGTR